MKVFIKPKFESLIIRDPITKNILPKEGAFVELTSFWKRRIYDGSVIVVEKFINEKKNYKVSTDKLSKKEEK